MSLFARGIADGHGGSMRRFASHVGKKSRIRWAMLPGAAAEIEARTRYPRSRRRPDQVVSVLKPGGYNAKIGNFSAKGRWRGMAIFTLTLEERATCPRSCRHWLSCYGNASPLAQRIKHGPALVKALERELRLLSRRHPAGFIVRLHVLGDFYSADYLMRWAEWLAQFPALHVYGYTAHPASSVIGRVVDMLNLWAPERWAVRHSNDTDGLTHALTVEDAAEAERIGAIVCPAQTGASDCCGTCGLCWQTRRPIAFLVHA